MLQVTWLVLTNQSALFQSREVMLLRNLLMASAAENEPNEVESDLPSARTEATRTMSSQVSPASLRPLRTLKLGLAILTFSLITSDLRKGKREKIMKIGIQEVAISSSHGRGRAVVVETCSWSSLQWFEALAAVFKISRAIRSSSSSSLGIIRPPLFLPPHFIFIFEQKINTFSSSLSLSCREIIFIILFGLQQNYSIFSFSHFNTFINRCSSSNTPSSTRWWPPFPIY